MGRLRLPTFLAPWLPGSFVSDYWIGNLGYRKCVSRAKRAGYHPITQIEESKQRNLLFFIALRRRDSEISAGLTSVIAQSDPKVTYGLYASPGKGTALIAFITHVLQNNKTI